MRIFLLLLFLFTVTTAQSQDIFNFKSDMVWMENAKIFVSKYEVTNGEYRAFTSELKDTSIHSKEQIYAQYYPDTTLWITEFRFGMGEGMNKYYYWHGAYLGYPVSGVSHEGAVKYCEWVTKKYGEGKYKFRLPTKKEFLMYSKIGNSKFAGGIDAPRNEKGKYLFNCKPDRIYLNDSVSKVFYNPSNNTFLRCYDDTATKDKDESWDCEIKGYDYYVENSYDGFLYLSKWPSKILKYKIPDSITFYNRDTKVYNKEKLILRLDSNYYDDGFMFTNPTRANKENEDLFNIVDENWKLIPYGKTMFKPNTSSYPADNNGLFDLNGNVSELVAEPGYLMGGNWNCDIKDCYYTIERRTDDIHQVLIGFRIVAEKL